MSENTHGKDLVDSLKEPVLEDPVALCAEAAAEIERLRVADGMLRHGIRQLELDLSVKTTEAERLRASEAQAIDDADALFEWLRYYDYPSCRFTTVVGAAIKPACMRALERRAKKGRK